MRDINLGSHSSNMPLNKIVNQMSNWRTQTDLTGGLGPNHPSLRGSPFANPMKLRALIN